MASEWQTVPIGSLCEGIYDGPHATPTKTSSGPLFLGISSLVNGRLDLSQSDHLSEDDFPRWTRRVLPAKDDLVFSYETRLGEAALIPEGVRCCLGRRMALMRLDRTKADPRYVLYAFLAPDFQEVIRSRTKQGSTVTRILLTEFDAFPIAVPPLKDQHLIGAFLSDIDERIDLLSRISKNLEAVAKAIFKSWFVDFEPVRANAEGREPEGMDAATAALFASAFEESSMGEIPSGWNLSSLATCVVFHNSSRIPLSSAQRARRHGPFPYYGAAGQIDSVDDFLFDGEYILVGEDGSVIDERGGPVVQHVWGRFWVSNHAHVLEPTAGWSIAAVRNLLGSINIRPYVTGAVQPKLSMTNLKRVPVIVPPRPLLKAYASLTREMDALKRLHKKTINTLTELRDTLIPRLISGKLRVPEAEKLVEAVL